MSRPGSLEPADLKGLRAPWAIVNAQVWTGTGDCHEAVAFGADGHVAASGRNGPVIGALPRGADIVDGRGATVTPGFVDPHVQARSAYSPPSATRAASAATG
jgi:imidazolonepropionase-like amidohydrolase